MGPAISPPLLLLLIVLGAIDSTSTTRDPAYPPCFPPCHSYLSPPPENAATKTSTACYEAFSTVAEGWASRRGPTYCDYIGNGTTLDSLFFICSGFPLDTLAAAYSCKNQCGEPMTLRPLHPVKEADLVAPMNGTDLNNTSTTVAPPFGYDLMYTMIPPSSPTLPFMRFPKDYRRHDLLGVTMGDLMKLLFHKIFGLLAQAFQSNVPWNFVACLILVGQAWNLMASRILGEEGVEFVMVSTPVAGYIIIPRHRFRRSLTSIWHSFT